VNGCAKTEDTDWGLVAGASIPLSTIVSAAAFEP
jgi:hypothetical protein